MSADVRIFKTDLCVLRLVDYPRVFVSATTNTSFWSSPLFYLLFWISSPPFISLLFIDCSHSSHLIYPPLERFIWQVGDPLTETEAEELVRESDLNGDGKINYFEFVAMTMKPWYINIVIITWSSHDQDTLKFELQQLINVTNSLNSAISNNRTSIDHF